MTENPYGAPATAGDDPSLKSRPLFRPIFWNVGAVALSVAYFAMILYLMDIGLTSEPESEIGHAVYRMLNYAFFPIGLVGTLVCTAALIINVRQQKWVWFAVVLFFSFFFFAHFSMLVSENIQAMQAR